MSESEGYGDSPEESGLSEGFSAEGESEGFLNELRDLCSEDDFGSSGEPLLDFGGVGGTIRYVSKSIEFVISGLIRLADFGIRATIRAGRDIIEDMKAKLEGRRDWVNFEEIEGADDQVVHPTGSNGLALG
jgi:hypothetical protein